MICPKCKHYTPYSPNYTKDSYGREWLEERCLRCGYATRNPCADDKEKTQQFTAYGTDSKEYPE